MVKNKGHFKVGNAGGPGRRKDPRELHLIKKLTRGEVELLIAQFMSKDIIELGKIATDPTSKVIDAMVANICKQAIIQGDQNRFNFLLDRTTGPITNKTEITNKYTELTDEEKLEKAREAVEHFEKKLITNKGE